MMQLHMLHIFQNMHNTLPSSGKDKLEPYKDTNARAKGLEP